MKARKDEYFSQHLRRHTRHKSAFPQLWWHKPDQILSLDSCVTETSLPDPNKKMSADLMVRSDNELLSYLALALAKGFAIGLWGASESNLLISQKLWSLPVSACGRTRVLLSCSTLQLQSPHHLAPALLLALLTPGPSAHLPTCWHLPLLHLGSAQPRDAIVLVCFGHLLSCCKPCTPLRTETLAIRVSHSEGKWQWGKSWTSSQKMFLSGSSPWLPVCKVVYICWHFWI